MSDEVTQEQFVDNIGFDDDSIQASDVDFYRGTSGVTDRIGIVSKFVKRARIHYKKGLGYVLCRSKPAEKDDKGAVVSPAEKALCCKHLPGAKTRCGTVVVHYHTNKQGEINPAQLFYTLKVWLFGEDKYVLIRSYNKEMPISENDIKIVCSDANYQKLQFMPAKGSMWQKEELGWKNEVLEEAKDLEEKLPRLMGKLLSDDDILDAVGISESPDDSSAEEKDLDSVLEGIG